MIGYRKRNVLVLIDHDRNLKFAEIPERMP